MKEEKAHLLLLVGGHEGGSSPSPTPRVGGKSGAIEKAVDVVHLYNIEESDILCIKATCPQLCPLAGWLAGWGALGDESWGGGPGHRDALWPHRWLSPCGVTLDPW